MEAQKKQGKKFGSPNNLHLKHRKLGLKRMRNKLAQNKDNQKVMQIIQKCRKAEMGW